MQPYIPPTRISLTSTQLQTMQADVSRRTPEEACGLLSGRRIGESVQVEEIYPMENILHSPERYQLDPEAQVEVFLSVERRGLEVVGIYHSHPKGPPHPSATDLDEAYYPEVVYLIWFYQPDRWDCRGFSIQERTASSIELMISKDE
jgi:proteasome lid subunit RPN8/RPN11